MPLHVAIMMTVGVFLNKYDGTKKRLFFCR